MAKFHMSKLTIISETCNQITKHNKIFFFKYAVGLFGHCSALFIIVSTKNVNQCITQWYHYIYYKKRYSFYKPTL